MSSLQLSNKTYGEIKKPTLGFTFTCVFDGITMDFLLEKINCQIKCSHFLFSEVDFLLHLVPGEEKP